MYTCTSGAHQVLQMASRGGAGEAIGAQEALRWWYAFKVDTASCAVTHGESP